MNRQPLTQKILVLGVDGLEPRLSRKYLEQGKMPNMQRFIERGACREDLVLLGAMPTVTPPLWTTLATGAYPGTHGITCFFAQDHEHLDSMLYNLDSRKCKAEPLWNVFAEEAGKPTLVWHWPGSSWPPTSESPNLHVVDGLQPSAINAGVAGIDVTKLVFASEKLANVEFLPDTAEIAPGAGCIIDDVEALMEQPKAANNLRSAITGGHNIRHIITCEEENEIYSLMQMNADTIKSPIKPASGWTNAPAGAKEFTLIVGKGTDRRPALLLANAQGVYDTVAIYHAKKDAEPYVTVKNGAIAFNVLDMVPNDDGQKIPCVRHYQVIDIAPDGSDVKMLLNIAMDISRDDFWHPKSLYQEIINNVGHVPARPLVSGSNENLVRSTMLPMYDYYVDWQADCLTYLMSAEKYDVIFSHLHNVDSMGHQFWHYAHYQEEWGNNALAYQKFMEDVYIQTDRYIGRFLPYLDQGWTIVITSDHGLITQEHLGVILGEPGGLNVPVMEELGYTVMQKDADGNSTHDVDWSKTRAVAIRGDHIYLNLKGRNPDGIVEPAEQYDLETQIISDLYNYRDPKTGKRVVALAMRNKDAVILGMNGPECGDIVYFSEEGFNKIHADSLSTQQGCADTSVSPIFMAAGPGIKAGYKTDRVIRQVDVAPTLAVLGGVRLPAQNEGSIVHQILTETF